MYFSTPGGEVGGSKGGGLFSEVQRAKSGEVNP